MSLKTKRKLDQAENNLFNKLAQGISQHNYQLPKSGTKGVTGSRGGSMYSNVKNGASLYDNPKSIINSGFSPQQGGQSDVLDSAMKTVGGIDIGESFKGRDRDGGEGRSEEVITNKGGAAPVGNKFLNTDNDAARIKRMIDEGEAAPGTKRPDITKESGEGKQVLVEDTGNNVDEALGNIKNQTNNDPDAGRFLKGVQTENNGRLADGYLDLGNGFKQAQALVRNIKSKQNTKVDPLSSNFKPGKLKRQTKRFIKQGVKSNEEFGNDDYRTNLDGLKPIDDANYNPKEGQKGVKPIPRGYMPKNMSNQQEIQNQKMAKIASNLTNPSTPISNNFSGQKNDEFNKSQMPKFDKGSGESGALNLDAAIKKEAKRKNLNDQVKASKTAIENKNENDKTNLKSVSGKIQDIDRGEGSIKGTPAVKKYHFENRKNISATNGGMLRGNPSSVPLSPKMTSRNNPKFNSTIGKGSDPNIITSGSITPSNPVNIKSNTPVVKSNKKQQIGEKPSGSKDKASASNPGSVSKQSRKNYLTSGINPNKKNTTVNKKPGGKNTTPVNNNKNKNTKKINTRKLNPTVNNKFNLEDELASVSSKKGL